jgi:hypothetical protein
VISSGQTAATDGVHPAACPEGDRTPRRISAMLKLVVARAARQTARAKCQPWVAGVDQYQRQYRT